MDRKALQDLMRREIAPPDAAEGVIALMKPAIRLRTLPPDELANKVGVSRIGGRPDLPLGMKWPVVNGHGLLFVAQINLAECHQYDPDGYLPSTGLLLFFYDWSVSTSSVFHIDPIPDDLSTCEPPEQVPDAVSPGWVARFLFGRSASRVFRACRVEFEQRISLVDSMSFAVDSMVPQPSFSEQYYDGISALTGDTDHTPIHQLLGNASTIQGAYLEAEFTDPSLRGSKPTNAQLTELLEWRLLAQFDTDDRPGMMWGDAGRIFYYIRESDLTKIDFKNVRVTLDCY